MDRAKERFDSLDRRLTEYCDNISNNFNIHQLRMLIKFSGIETINGKSVNMASKEELCSALTNDLEETRQSRKKFSTDESVYGFRDFNVRVDASKIVVIGANYYSRTYDNHTMDLERWSKIDPNYIGISNSYDGKAMYIDSNPIGELGDWNKNPEYWSSVFETILNKKKYENIYMDSGVIKHIYPKTANKMFEMLSKYCEYLWVPLGTFFVDRNNKDTREEQMDIARLAHNYFKSCGRVKDFPDLIGHGGYSTTYDCYKSRDKPLIHPQSIFYSESKGHLF